MINRNIIFILLLALSYSQLQWYNHPELIWKKLSLDKKLFNDAIETLEGLGIITILKGNIICNKTNLHLPEDSDIFLPYSIGLKTLGANKFYSTAPEGRYNFSVVFSADEKTKNDIRSKFLDFLKKVKPLVEKSKEKDVFQMDFNLFPWS